MDIVAKLQITITVLCGPRCNVVVDVDPKSHVKAKVGCTSCLLPEVIQSVALYVRCTCDSV